MSEEQLNVNEAETKVEESLEQPLTGEAIANNPDQEMTEVSEEKAADNNAERTATEVAQVNQSDVANKEEANFNALKSLPTRSYLDQTVVPILLQALGAVAKERPPNPIDFVANYLLTNKDRFN
uniref:Dpy-30-like protein n=1 Tax=Acrobeloides nanus TaxID=290746 RepID=A0A914D1I8_9BILA